MRKQLQASIGAAALLSAAPAFAELVYEGDTGTLAFSGDVELDINSYNMQSGPIFTEQNIDTSDEYNQTGRVLLQVRGERSQGANYARFKVQPLMQTDGTFGLDDAWLKLGNTGGTTLKIGRFEAYDLFPLGQDIFIEYNGNTSDSLYSDGQGYVYQAKEGRGRAGDAGQVMLRHRRGTLHAEVSTLFGNRSDLFASSTYHGFDIGEDDAKNSFIVRPVVAWSPGPWTLAAGMETNLVSDALVDEQGDDISDRTGYGTRLSYAAGGFTLNANLAYLDAHEEENLTLGLNALWGHFGIGYIRADNEIDEVKPGASNDFTAMAGEYTVDTLYTSYRFADVLAITNLDIYLGAFYSQVDHEAIDDLDDADRYGGRLRFKYLF